MTVPSRRAGGHCPLSVPPSPARAGAPSPWAAALGGHGSPALAGAPRGSGHGDRDLASAWAAGAGGTPWLRAPLPTSHEVPCLPSPGGASPGRARWCRGSRAVPQFPPSQLRLCPLAPRCWLLAQRGTALPGGACCAGTAPRTARGARGAHPHPQRGLGAATVGKRRHEAAFDGGGRSCRSPPTQVGTPCPCGALGCWGVFGVLWGCERGTWGWTVRGTPPLGTGWPRMALWKLRVTDGCVGVLGTPGPGAGRGQTPGPGQDAPWGPGGARWAELRGRWHPNRTGHPRAQGSRHPLPSLPLLQRHRNSGHVGFSSAGKLWVGLHPPVEVCDPWHGTATAPGCGDPLNPRCDPRVGFPPSPPILVLALLGPGSVPEPWRGGGGAEAGVPPGHWHTGCPRRRFPTPGRGCGCRGAPGSPGAGRKQPAGPRAGAARSAFTRDLAEPQHLVCSWSRAPLPPRPGGTAGSPLLRGGPGWGPG